MTFWLFLKRQTHRDDPVGDFARDAVADVTFPKLAVRRETLRQHLEAMTASQPARQAFERAYDEWSDRVCER